MDVTHCIPWHDSYLINNKHQPQWNTCYNVIYLTVNHKNHNWEITGNVGIWNIHTKIILPSCWSINKNDASMYTKLKITIHCSGMPRVHAWLKMLLNFKKSTHYFSSAYKPVFYYPMLSISFCCHKFYKGFDFLPQLCMISQILILFHFN